MPGVAQAVLKRVAAVLVAGSLGGTAWLAVPEEVMESLLDPAELSEYAPADRLRLLRHVATDPRPGVRRTLAARFAELTAGLEHDGRCLVHDLAADGDPGVRRVLSASLGALLPELAPLERSTLLLPMAASDDANVRFVAASVLAWPFEAIGTRSAIALLARDASPVVRDAAGRAARARGISLG